MALSEEEKLQRQIEAEERKHAAEQANLERQLEIEREKTRREEVAAEAKAEAAAEAERRKLEAEERKAEATAEAEGRKKAERAEKEALAEQKRREQAAEKAAKEAAARREKARQAEVSRVKSAKTVAVPISPSAIQVQSRRAPPFANLENDSFWLSLAAAFAGVAAEAIMVTALPVEDKWAGAALGGLVGAIMTMTSPIGTWASEAGSGAFASALAYAIAAAMNRTESNSV